MSVINQVLLDWKIFLLTFGLILTVVIINSNIQILPVSVLNFIICSLSVWFLSMWITLIGLHKLLQQNKPLEFDLFKKKNNLDKITKKDIKPNAERIKALTNDIDKYFISKWYINISDNEDFKVESKIVLENVITKLLEVQLSLNNKTLLHGLLNIYLKHLKQFRRTLKRKEKYSGEIIDLYRYSHTCSTSTKSKEYFIHQLTINLLNHFLNWELWNSLPCHILVSIIARKLTMYLLKMLSTPELINYYLLMLVSSDNVKTKLHLNEYNRIHIKGYSNNDSPKKVLNETITNEVKENSPEIENRNDCIKIGKTLTVDSSSASVEEAKEAVVEKSEQLTEKKLETAQKDRSVSKPVKIYEPKSATKTWNDAKDLTSVSWGQDPLDIIQDTDKNSTKSFWESCTIKSEEITEESPTSAANLLFNEVKNMTTMEGIKSSIKPFSDATVHTLHNIKDLQESTVNNALTKIGDLQDEAAGVVEGILDFGRAGFRKGLRLTGLQENIENAKPTTVQQQQPPKTPRKKPAKLTRSDSQEKNSSGDSNESSVWVNPLQFDSPSFDGHILLEKPKTENEKIIVKGETEQPVIPFISMNLSSETESPDPEYEETADLASTIAKLRSLLQQKSSESNLSTPALSPMPPDDFSHKILENDNIGDLDVPDGMMPSFMKFCAKTTDVFHKSINTIKTALPGNVPGTDYFNIHDKWMFIQTENKESDLINRVKKLVNERKDFCTVDTAYEALDSLDTMQQSSENIFKDPLQFEDELDDFEGKLPLTRSIVDILCELLADDVNTPFIQEPIVKAFLLSFGLKMEQFIEKNVDNFMEYFGTHLFTIPESTVIQTLEIDLEDFVEAILTSFPDCTTHIFGKATMNKALTLFVSSLQIQKINQDALIQAFELFSLKLIDASNRMSPPASA